MGYKRLTNLFHLLPVAALLTLGFAPLAEAQSFVCSDYWNLKMDSSSLHDMSYPYIKSKRVFPDTDNPHILLYFQGFYESLLYDIDTLNFELVDLTHKNSQIIRIPVDSVFQSHKEQPRYKVNDFTLYGNRLFILVFKTIYVFESDFSNNWHFRSKFRNPNRGFQRISSMDSSDVILFDLTDKSGNMNSIVGFKGHLTQGQIFLTDSILVPFDGKPYFHTESSYFSESDSNIFIGSATSSRITVISKPDLTVSRSFYHTQNCCSGDLDNLEFKDKMQFYNTLFSDTANFHYLTSYISDEMIIRSRCRVPGKSIHYLDIYQLRKNQWDSVTTLIEGTRNYKMYRDSTSEFSLLSFDPMSSTKNYILVNNALYTIDLRYNVSLKTDKQSTAQHYVFPLKELRSLGKELYQSKDFEFNIYEYKIR